MNVCVLSPFSLVWLCDPMDCSPPGSSGHGILQARILEWVAMPSSRGSSWPRERTHISCIGKWVLYHLCHLRGPTTERPHSSLKDSSVLLRQVTLPEAKHSLLIVSHLLSAFKSDSFSIAWGSSFLLLDGLLLNSWIVEQSEFDL